MDEPVLDIGDIDSSLIGFIKRLPRISHLQLGIEGRQVLGHRAQELCEVDFAFALSALVRRSKPSRGRARGGGRARGRGRRRGQEREEGGGTGRVGAEGEKHGSDIGLVEEAIMFGVQERERFFEGLDLGWVEAGEDA